MTYTNLGNTGLKVSRLCFGALTIGPLQADLPLDEGSEVILEALCSGINFIDTAELYKTYPYINAALKKFNKDDVVIASKCYAYDRQGAVRSVEKARKQLDRDVVDIFLLHEQESIHTIRGHMEALEYFFECKQRGIIKAVGISTHNVAGVIGATQTSGIEVIHPMINYKGIGIADGSLQDMLCAVRKAYDMGIGIYAMKPLGGGNLLSNFAKSMDYILALDCVHSVAIGMKNVQEVRYNVDYVSNGGSMAPPDFEGKRLHVEGWCIGCGQCVGHCSQNAIQIQNGKLSVNDNCVLCGYCGAACEHFALKII